MWRNSPTFLSTRPIQEAIYARHRYMIHHDGRLVQQCGRNEMEYMYRFWWWSNGATRLIFDGKRLEIFAGNKTLAALGWKAFFWKSGPCMQWTFFYVTFEMSTLLGSARDGDLRVCKQLLCDIRTDLQRAREWDGSMLTEFQLFQQTDTKEQMYSTLSRYEHSHLLRSIYRQNGSPAGKLYRRHGDEWVVRPQPMLPVSDSSQLVLAGSLAAAWMMEKSQGFRAIPMIDREAVLSGMKISIKVCIVLSLICFSSRSLFPIFVPQVTISVCSWYESRRWGNISTFW